MGISSKKSTTAQQSTSTTTPNVPQWGSDSLKGLNDQISLIAGTDPNNFVAPASGLQTTAFTGAQNLGGWAPASQSATDLATRTAGTAAPTTQAAGIFDNGISQYLNPYMKEVVDSSLADFDQGADATRARQEAQGAQGDAFGGARWGLQEGETEGQLARARGSLSSGLHRAGYDSATTLANDDANRRQTANDTNASLANEGLNRNSNIAALLHQISDSTGANQRADVTTQGDLGGTQRDIAQSQATAPISLAQTVAQLLGQNQLPLLTGQTTNSSGTGSTTSTPSTMEQIGQGVQLASNLAALFASDRRLKRDVVPIGVRPDGLRVYLYRYLWSPILHAGVMAQEVLKVKPEAVVTMPNGFLAVDYGKL